MSLRAPVIVVGVAAVLLLAAPFGLGLLAESNLRGQLEQMEEYPVFSFEITEYERGWFSSNATVEVSPGSMYQGMIASDPMMQSIFDQIRAPFLVELAHGPILTLNGFGIGSYAVRSRLDPEQDWVAEGESELGVPYLIEMRVFDNLAYSWVHLLPPWACYEIVPRFSQVASVGHNR